MTRVLVVGMLDSVHLGRWLRQFVQQDIEFLLFPSSPHRRLHPEVSKLMVESPEKFRVAFGNPVLAILTYLLNRLTRNHLGALLLRREAVEFRPHVLHAVEMQHAGYLVLRAFEKKKIDFEILTTNYGSDIFWFQRYSTHRKKIVRLLRISDRYSAECERDVELARDFGLAGRVMPIIPNAGGLSDAVLNAPQKPSDCRNTIAIKGYHGWVGRAGVAVLALPLIASELQGLRVVFFSCNLKTLLLVWILRRITGLDVVAHGKGKLSHQQMLDLFLDSRLFVGISLSDGISTSMLEAMACGAIPVQTDSSCCSEWFQDSGVRVGTISRETVAEAILKGLKLAKDPSNAKRNRETIFEKARQETIETTAHKFYR